MESIEKIEELKKFLNTSEQQILDTLVKKANEEKERQYGYVLGLLDRLNQGESVSSDILSITDIESNPQSDELRIGEYAKKNLYPILQSFPFSNFDVEMLCSNDSRKLFGLGFPLLMSDADYQQDQKQNGSKRAGRYYREKIKINGNDYHLCSQWQKDRKAVLKKAIDEFLKNHQI